MARRRPDACGSRARPRGRLAGTHLAHDPQPDVLDPARAGPAAARRCRRRMTRVLITGMSGTGKSTVIQHLAALGHAAVDTDSDEWCEWMVDEAGERDWVWREERIAQLL